MPERKVTKEEFDAFILKYENVILDVCQIPDPPIISFYSGGKRIGCISDDSVRGKDLEYFIDGKQTKS